MTEHYAPLREVRRWMRVSTPVNKAAASGLRGQLPQIAGPLVIGALGVGAIGAGIAWRALASTRGTGRTQRFAELASSALEAAFPETFIDEVGVGPGERGSSERRVVNVEVGEGFGRPSLVSIDVVAPALDELANVEVATEALDALTRAVWNNAEMAPVSVRARVLVARGDADSSADARAVPGAQTKAVADMAVLGFEDEIARPDELYALRRARLRPCLEAVTFDRTERLRFRGCKRAPSRTAGGSLVPAQSMTSMSRRYTTGLRDLGRRIFFPISSSCLAGSLLGIMEMRPLPSSRSFLTPATRVAALTVSVLSSTSSSAQSMIRANDKGSEARTRAPAAPTDRTQASQRARRSDRPM